MKLTFIDSGVLIAAYRGIGREGDLALEILDDGEREFASSILVMMEILPKTEFFQREQERNFYQRFFRDVSKWATVDVELTESAFNIASAAGLAAMDALHLAAARQTGCEEFVTTEKPSKPIHRTNLMTIRTIHP